MSGLGRRGSTALGLATLAGRGLAAIVGGLLLGLLLIASAAKGAPPPGDHGPAIERCRR